ncbi:hypothetical protein PRIC1_014425 [Phytophthora ramorum]
MLQVQREWFQTVNEVLNSYTRTTRFDDKRVSEENRRRVFKCARREIVAIETDQWLRPQRPHGRVHYQERYEICVPNNSSLGMLLEALKVAVM